MGLDRKLLAESGPYCDLRGEPVPGAKWVGKASLLCQTTWRISGAKCLSKEEEIKGVCGRNEVVYLSRNRMLDDWIGP